jgi:GNAT superfamily N-acetyltransferase
MNRVRDDGFVVDDDKDRLDVARIHQWLSEEAYWALGRSLEQVLTSISNSVVLGCFAPNGNQVGIARWVTDGATFGWLCDVFVESEFRGRGLGTFLVQSAVDHPQVDGLRTLLLATRDAHDLYQRFGFVVTSEPRRWMERRS